MRGLGAALLLSVSTACASPRWRVVHEERFEKPVSADASAWVRDTLGPESPWYCGPLSDGGTFFMNAGGPDFRRQLEGFSIYRKRVPFGEDGWLTLELAARDRTNDGRPDEPPSLSTGVIAGRPAALIMEPAHDGGILIRSTKPLPPAYRVEVELAQVDFGGSRGGVWEYAGRRNGYRVGRPKTNHPWTWGPSPEYALPPEKWTDVTGSNGFYYLALVDYPEPAPHNNIFIHTHRKVVIDGYHAPDGASDVCDPVTRSYYKSMDSTVNAFFALAGPGLESRAVMKTECGTVYGGEGGRTPYVAAVQLVPESLPNETYRFAVERDAEGYTIELSGRFRFAGEKTYRYRRRFVEDGRPVWHYDQAAYPESFVIGDPHLNFYEGSAAISRVSLLVPR